MASIVYCYTNKKNDKKYIGVTTKNLNQRHHQHIYAACIAQKDTIFYKTIRKYGQDIFGLPEILEQSDLWTLKELYKKEEDWIKKLHSHLSENGYNMTFGGRWNYPVLKGTHQTPEHIKKRTEKRIGQKHTQEAIEKNRRSNSKIKFKIISPNGEFWEIFGFKKFCDEHNLNPSSFGGSLRTHKAIKFGPYKGWQAIRLGMVGE
jgi:group I intron endonuclease